jgi:hypothetical protein
VKLKPKMRVGALVLLGSWQLRSREVMWSCRCDCGAVVELQGRTIQRGREACDDCTVRARVEADAAELLARIRSRPGRTARDLGARIDALVLLEDRAAVVYRPGPVLDVRVCARTGGLAPGEPRRVREPGTWWPA